MTEGREFDPNELKALRDRKEQGDTLDGTETARLEELEAQEPAEGSEPAEKPGYGAAPSDG